MKKFIFQRETIFALVGGVFLLLALTTWQLSVSLAIIFYILSYITAGYYKAKEGLLELLHDRSLSVEILMILAAIGAAVIGHWGEGAVLIFIFSISGALETYSLEKSEKDLSHLITLAPEEAILQKEDGTTERIAVSALEEGMKLLVKNGERVPADGTVSSGHTSIDEASITGEPLPVEKTEGDEVFNGTINGSGTILMTVTRKDEDSLFRKMIRLVEEAKENRPPSQQLIEKIEGPYVIGVLSVVALMLLSPLVFDFSFETVFYRAMVLLVVASPCAVVASIMPALLAGLSTGARKGVLMKGGTYLEVLAHAKAVAFDKTGTITKGEPVVTDFYVMEEKERNEILDSIVSVEQQSSHPLANAIVAYGMEKGMTGTQTIVESESKTGLGIEAYTENHRFRIGNARFMNNIPEELEEGRKKWQSEGKTVMFLEKDGRTAGLIAVKDEIREEAKQLIQSLNKRGTRTIMITGDNEATAASISREAGLTDWVSECMPEQKVKEIEKLKETYDKVVMVGDGVNDAPAMAQADVGIAMGSGTDAAIETSDIVLIDSDLEQINLSFRLSTRLRRIVFQNLTFSMSVILILIAANFMQSLNLPFAVIGHEGSTILVILNGLRMLRE
ncbi:heavy metal translocating P-type ATPase [Salimicrobium flavidum]|uniref:Cd2+/Zn2+-exporting ATPase n=1 Tax=Salimicrobium flavidum TaxID=570947 RepID=A0A1N7IRJ2_9BACI|nr:heavy metal translocating P-type ATPase [Salimicrobium flavidum]SIS39714.1 Cd2+/Zn2+-exporting ATPase [Salimicrobium flavidum]